MQLHCFTGEMWAQRCERSVTPPPLLHSWASWLRPSSFVPHLLLLPSILSNGFLWHFLIGFSENFAPHSLSIKHLHINTFTLLPDPHLCASYYIYVCSLFYLPCLVFSENFAPFAFPSNPAQFPCNLFNENPFPLLYFQAITGLFEIWLSY